MTAEKILEAVKKHLKEDMQQYMADGSGHYDIGFYASQILLAINVMENGRKNEK